MKRHLIFCALIVLLGAVDAVAQSYPRPKIREQDGSPSVRFSELIVGNGTLTVSGTKATFLPVGGSGDFSSNTTTSVDGEIVVFSGTGGKTGKRLNLGSANYILGMSAAADANEYKQLLASGAISITHGANQITIGSPAFTGD